MTTSDPAPPPAGTATFLLTGMERSTALWEFAPDAAAAATTRQHELIDQAVHAHDGVTSGGTVGESDSTLAVFASSAAAAAAALAIQRSFAAEAWPDGLTVRVRIGLYTGEVHGHAGRDAALGVAAHRCARLRDVAHPSQTLLSQATALLVAEALADGVWLEDLGAHRLRDLARPERLYALRHPELPGDFPPLRSLDVLPNNLPAQLTSFVGRDGELAEVQALLAGRRLVTLAGAGGSGKTRLAAQAAAALTDRWPDGVWWVDLASVTDPELVAKLTSSVLRVPVEPVGRPLRALASQLRGRRLLICLDTCEHLLDACAELADQLLRSCPEVSVLATSREPLGVPGETVWRVPSLAEDEAVRLFADRAELVRPGFTVEAHEDAVRMICRRLDGIPLAIELAAAWMRALSPTQIAAGMDDWFRSLAGGQRSVIARQRTLAASMDWSHDLLEEADRAVFRRLAVFPGRFTLDAARAVSSGGQTAEGEALTAIGRLVDKSLVVVGERDGEARYRLLDTVRQYAQDLLEEAGETEVTRDRHLEHFLAFAVAAESELERDQDRWRQVLEGEHDNFRAALRWGLAADRPHPDRGRRLAAALAQFWFLHGHTREARGFLDRAIELAPEDRSSLQGRLLAGTAMVALAAGQPPAVTAAAQQGLEIAVAAGDDRTRARCLMLLGYGAFYHDFPAAQERLAQARSFSQAVGDDFATCFTLMWEAFTLHEQDRHRESLALAKQAYRLAMARGERFSAALARDCEAFGVLFGGDVRRAEALATEAVDIAEPLGDYFTVGCVVSNLARIKSLSGDLDGGRRIMESIAQPMEDADMVGISFMALGLGRLHLCGGDFQGAAEWYAQGTRVAEPTTDNRLVCKALSGLAGALRRLGRYDEAREHADRAAELARKLGAYHPLSDALEELAFLAAADDPANAEDLHHQALAVRVQYGLRPLWVDSLEALAGLAALAGSVEEATRMVAASQTAREQMGYPRPAVDQPDTDATLDAARAALGPDAFTRVWSEGAALSLEDAVAYATRGRGTRARPPTGWASLTPTERDVVGLVAAGLTNPQIAARLFISRATVKTHLSHSYAKLGVANRTELATLVTSNRAAGVWPPG